MTYYMFPYFIALNLKFLFLEHAVFLGFMCSVVTKAKKKKKCQEIAGQKKTEKTTVRKTSKWHEHLRCHRWNPEYPPGKPGKPHPVGCALNGEAEIETEKKENLVVSQT